MKSPKKVENQEVEKVLNDTREYKLGSYTCKMLWFHKIIITTASHYNPVPLIPRLYVTTRHVMTTPNKPSLGYKPELETHKNNSI